MLFLMRKLGERITVTNSKTGDSFEIMLAAARVRGINSPHAIVKVGVNASNEFDIVRDDAEHEFLRAPLARFIAGLAYNRKDCTCSYEELHSQFRNHPKHEQDMDFNDFCEGLHALCAKMGEIKYFIQIDLTDGYVRLTDQNFLQIKRRKQEKLNNEIQPK